MTFTHEIEEFGFALEWPNCTVYRYGLHLGSMGYLTFLCDDLPIWRDFLRGIFGFHCTGTNATYIKVSQAVTV